MRKDDHTVQAHEQINMKAVKGKSPRTLWMVIPFFFVLIVGYATFFSKSEGDLPTLSRKSRMIPEGALDSSEPSVLPLRMAIGAMISPKDTEGHYRRLLQYLGQEAGVEVELVQRKTYAEINELLISGDIQLAFICSGPYVTGQKGLTLLSTPQIQGKHTYHSYLIVHKDSDYKDLLDLQGKVFAFTDPDSNTGSLVPKYWLRQQGVSADSFFSETIFTYSHDNSILAVAKGLVDAAAVDSLIWDFYKHNGSDITDKTKVIKTSAPYGIPPIVASTGMPEIQQKQFQAILLRMHEASEGKEILDKLLIDRFVVPEDSWYASIRKMQRDITQDQ